MPLSPNTTDSSERLTPRPRSFLRSVFRVVAAAVAGLGLLVLLILLVLQLPIVAGPVAQIALELANPWPGTTATVRAAGGTWLTELWVREVRISSADGSLVISIDSLGATYDLLALSHGELRFKTVRLIRPVVITGTTPDGDLEVLGPFRSTPEAEPDTSEGLRISGGSVAVSLGAFLLHSGGDSSGTTFDISNILIAAGEVSIGGKISLELDTLSAVYRPRPNALESVHVELSGEMADNLITVRTLQARSPGSSIRGSGTLALPFDTLFTPHATSFQLDANPIAYRDLHPFVPAFGPEGEASVRVTLSRDALQSSASAVGKFAGGGSFEATGSAKAHDAGEPSLRAELTISDVSIEAFTGKPDTLQRISVHARLSGQGSSPGSFTGSLTGDLDVHGLVGPRRLQTAFNVSLVDGAATVHGQGTLDALRFVLDGHTSAFSDPPTYDLTARAEIPAAGGDAHPDGLFQRLKGMSATVHASGAGFNPLVGTSQATVRAEWTGNSDARSFTFDASSGDSVAIARGLFTTKEGRLQLDALANFGSLQEIVLRSLEFQRLNLRELLGLEGSASLSGSASGFVRGMDPTTLTGAFALRLDSSRVGTTHIAQAEVEARIEDGVVTARITGQTTDGDMRLRGSAEPFAKRPSVTVEAARFEGLDLGGLLLGDDGATDLNGSVQLHLVMEPASGAGSGTSRGASERRPGLVGTVRVDLGRSRIYRQDILSTELVAELTGSVAAVELDLRTPEGGALISGSVQPFKEFPDMRLTNGLLKHVDFGALAGLDSLSTDLSGALSVDLEGTSWETASGSVVFEFLPSRINREELSEGKLEVAVLGGDVSLRGHAVLGTGSINVVGSAAFHDEQLSLAADAELDLHDLSRLTRDTTLSGSNARVSFAARGIWGLPEATRIDGRLYANGSIDSIRIDSLVAVLAVAGRTIRVDSLLVGSNAGVIRGAGPIAIFDSTGATESDFHVNASLASLNRVGRVAGLEFSSTGTAELSASLTGTGRAGRLDVSTDIANLDVEGVLISALTARGSARLGTALSIESMSAEATAGDLGIGDFVFDNVIAAAKAEGSVSSFRFSAALASGEKLALAGTGEQLDHRYAVTLDSVILKVGERTWVLEDRARIDVGKGIAIDGLSIVSGPRKISAYGTLDPEGQQDFHVEVDSLALDQIARFLGRPKLGGDLTFSGVVTGPAHDAKATGRLDAHITSDGEPVGTVESDAEWTGNLFKVTSIVTQPDQSTLKAIISLPATLPFVSEPSPTHGSANGVISNRREFALQTDGFDLKFLEPFFNPQAIPEPRGLLTADIALQREAGKYSGRGHIAIDTGFVRVSSIGVEYSDIQLRASLSGSDFVVDSLSARTGEGGGVASGTVSLASLDDPVFDVLVKLNRFVGINTQSMRAVADGSVALGGTLTLPVITGDVTVDEAHFVVPESAGEAQVESVELTDADYAILRKRFGYRRPASGNSSASDSTRFSLDVTLHFPRMSWIRKKANPSLSVEIEGDLKVRSVPGEPLTMVGTLRPVAGRSYVSQFGRQFEIKSGELQFSGAPEQFTMNVESEYKVPARSGSGMSEATIRMRVERRLERFQFDLSSDPPMEQADILSYLTTGTATTGAFASTSSQGNLATSAALEQMVGVIGGLTEDKIPLDIFQIRQDGARGITIVAGNYVTPKTYVGVRYPILLQQTGQDNYYDTGTEFEVEYQSFPWLFWNAKGGSTRLMLLLKTRYAY